MGLFDKVRAKAAAKSKVDPKVFDGRRVDLKSGFNIRELGDYPTPMGTTVRGRFLRSGSTSSLEARDAQALLDFGVTHVLDLRGSWEVGSRPDYFANHSDVTYLNVQLYDFDLSDPNLQRDDQMDDGAVSLGSGYLQMLANKPAIHQIFSFFSDVPRGECTLFHCAAGMDRTGVTAMLLLGLIGAPRELIIADYCYSFESIEKVNAYVMGEADPWGDHANTDKTAIHGYGADELGLRHDTIAFVYDRLIDAYGSVPTYLRACGIPNIELARVRTNLLV